MRACVFAGCCSTVAIATERVGTCQDCPLIKSGVLESDAVYLIQVAYVVRTFSFQFFDQQRPGRLGVHRGLAPHAGAPEGEL